MTAAIAPSIFASAPLRVTAPTLLNLLIVDEERSVREGCRDVATVLGYKANVCESAEQALRMMESQNFDVLFLDLRANGGNGLEILRTLKTQRPETEVVIITGNGSVESAVNAMKSGAYDYLTKPFSM